MLSIQRLIQGTGGFARLCQEPLDVDHPPYQSLCIRHLGAGPRELPLIQVAQMFGDGGRVTLDSEMDFEIRLLSLTNWIWMPVSFRKLEPNLSIRCIWTEPDGHLGFDKQAFHGLTVIAESWDAIIIQRGYPGSGGAI